MIGEINNRYDAKVIEPIENYVTDEFRKFYLADETSEVFRKNQRSIKSLTRSVNLHKNSLWNHQNKSHKEITREHFESYNDSIELSTGTIAQLSKEKKFLEDSLGKISKMIFSQAGLLEHLVLGLTDKINYKNERIEFHETHIANLVELKENFNVHNAISEITKQKWENIEKYEAFILRTENFKELKNKSDQELKEQLSNQKAN